MNKRQKTLKAVLIIADIAIALYTKRRNKDKKH